MNNSNSRSVREWFKWLSEEEEQNAIANVKAQVGEKHLDTIRNTLPGAIDCFIWAYSDQGQDYWSEVHNKISMNFYPGIRQSKTTTDEQSAIPTIEG